MLHDKSTTNQAQWRRRLRRWRLEERVRVIGFLVSGSPVAREPGRPVRAHAVDATDHDNSDQPQDDDRCQRRTRDSSRPSTALTVTAHPSRVT